MLDIKSLLPELKKLVTDLSADLLARSTAKDDPYSTEVDAGLREAYTQIEKGGRTADAFEVWREDYLDQVAVAWVLGCVFVRFMEDNHLIDECWLAGDGERRKLAEDTHELYFREHPHESDREYFEHVFREVGKIPACRDLFAEGKTPLWAVGPSGDMAMKLLAFWREIEPETGHLVRSFQVEDGDTRFLGDLYQDLSERARKKYALLQTPVFVEEFILDRTLDPAIDEFGLDEVRMIDPTCGSGHFLLGGFSRLFDLWIKRKDNEVVAAQKSLDGVWGCDINPFAVAIARFRLIVAALRACGIKRLKDAPAWSIHLATGDSLLFGSRWDRDGNKKGEQQFFKTDEESWAPEIYACEDKEAISEVLGQQYHAVVGNPPYITPKDKSLNKAYRERYATCHRQYSLAVPFMERFFDLAKAGSGRVGQITANSFMKREFGKKLIEQFFKTIELTHVVDTSGAYIPGHGTPTVILLGINRLPVTDTVRAVLGIKGEPTTPNDPKQGFVWKSIVSNIDASGTEDEFTSCADSSRDTFTKHPWSLSGGGAADLKKKLDEKQQQLLKDIIDPPIGRAVRIGEETAFTFDRSYWRRMELPEDFFRLFAKGEEVRDWTFEPKNGVFYPYAENGGASCPPQLEFLLWPQRTALKLRPTFSGTFESSGLKWFEYQQHTPSAYKTPLSVMFPNIASHNHFVLDRGGTVFDCTAPVIKLPESASESDHLAILGLLNSSVACFWMKQVSHQKQMMGGDGIRISSRAKVPYQFAGTRLMEFPIPSGFIDSPLRDRLASLAGKMDTLAGELTELTARNVLEKELESGREEVENQLRYMVAQRSTIRSQMVFLQEEIDFSAYALFGLASESLLVHKWDVVCDELDVGARPFELIQQNNLDGFPVRSCVAEIWPDEVQAKWKQRIEAIRESSDLKLIEDDHYKRRWIGRQGLFNHAARQDEIKQACCEWLLDRLETSHYWPNSSDYERQLQSVAKLSEKARADRDFMTVASIFRQRDDFDVALLVSELIDKESVPVLPSMRYKPSGLRKRMAWERTWELQRQEDAGEIVDEIKSPPKYKTADFQKPDYWRLRGKLDVPKERWISFPYCETESDPSLVVGSAGWNHLQQAIALVAYYDARKREGWDAKRLTPLLAALDQLIPWIHQWHPEVDPEFGETAGQSFQTMLEADAHELGLTLDEIRAWEPPKKTTTRRKRTKK